MEGNWKGRAGPVSGDELVLDTPTVREFVAFVRRRIAEARSPEEACAAIRPRFAELLTHPGWLPDEYARDVPGSGMGGGIGQWLLYRAEDGSLSLFSLVVPPGSETPVHNHLAWGLVGLYRGTQDEEIFARREGTSSSSSGVHSGRATSTLSSRRRTTSTACGRPRPRRPSLSTCSRTTPAASGAMPTSPRPEPRPPSSPVYANTPCKEDE